MHLVVERRAHRRADLCAGEGAGGCGQRSNEETGHAGAELIARTACAEAEKALVRGRGSLGADGALRVRAACEGASTDLDPSNDDRHVLGADREHESVAAVVDALLLVRGLQGVLGQRLQRVQLVPVHLHPCARRACAERRCQVEPCPNNHGRWRRNARPNKSARYLRWTMSYDSAGGQHSAPSRVHTFVVRGVHVVSHGIYVP